MSGEWKIRLSAEVTSVPNRFIDEYMAMADGEDVKVFLYFLRHEGDGASPEDAARDLHMSLKEISRALRIWKRAGIMELSEEEDPEVSAGARPEKTEQSREREIPREVISLRTASGESIREMPAPEPAPCTVDLEELNRDPDFTQLLYIGERYLNKTFNPNDVQTLGYLYRQVGISGDLLEYVIEYCAQNSHTSLRYIEKVALAWHEKGIVNVDEAKAYAGNYTGDMFAAMKALGLSGRGPGESEKKLLEKWYREWGFSRELVVEACSRTIERIHQPSFKYADGILSGWKQAGITTIEQVAGEDLAFQESQKNLQGTASLPEENSGAAGDSGKSGSKKAASGEKGRGQRSGRTGRTAKPATRFHNLDEHGYDYDEMVWSMVAPAGKPGGNDGAE